MLFRAIDLRFLIIENLENITKAPCEINAQLEQRNRVRLFKQLHSERTYIYNGYFKVESVPQQ